MQSEILSLTDYIHAFQVVLQRLLKADAEPKVGKLCAEALEILDRAEAAHLRRGVGVFDQADFERISGQHLPDRVAVWLSACCLRLVHREFQPLAAQILNLCRCLEYLLAAAEQGKAAPANRLKHAGPRHGKRPHKTRTPVFAAA